MSSTPDPKIPSVQAQLLLKIPCELGECVLYDDVQHSLLWTDILGKKFHKLSLHDNKHQSFDCPKMLGSFALLPADGPTGYLCAWQDGFQLYDIENGKALSDMSVGEPVNPLGLPTRLNDGRCDNAGRRFICGGYFGGVDNAEMTVFRVEYNGDGNKLMHSPIHGNVRVTNSICFSPDNKTMYFADSPTQIVHAFDYDNESGDISNKRLLHKAPVGVPDGSCVDSEGYLWNAVWRSGAGSSMVNRIHPASGEIVYSVVMPDGTSQVTCCCFGGNDFDELYISTAAEDTDSTKEPNAGGIYVAKVGVKGRKEARFVGK
jgi:sugar lactone lactonase YvrE